MKNLGVVITDGVGFRNFIHTDFIEEVKSKFDSVVVFSCLPIGAYQDAGCQCEVVELDLFKENNRVWFFRKAKELAHLSRFRHENKGFLRNYNANKPVGYGARDIAARLVIYMTRLLNSEKWTQRFERLQQRALDTNELTKRFGELLAEHSIDLLFFTHQRPPFIAPLIRAAAIGRVPTASFIFSWDNLSSKGRMAGNFDYYLLWSELMKTEMMHYYEQVEPSRLFVIGTPQFEPYVLDRYKMERSDFLNTFGLDGGKPLILFTCNDASSTNDPYFLEILAGFIESGQIEAELLVRTSPAETPDRFLHLQGRFPFLKWNFPEWPLSRENHAEPWSQRIPSFEDLRNLRAMLTHCDVIVNVLSTIMLDGFLFGKPSICPVFGATDRDVPDFSFALDFGHLRVVEKSGAIRIARTKEMFLKMVLNALDNPSELRQQQEDLLKTEIGRPLKGTSRRIAETLRALASE